MHIPSLRLWTSVAALSVLCSVAADASNVRYMKLRDLVARGDRIVRGTVVASEEGTVQAGGGDIPIVTYRIRVERRSKAARAPARRIDVKLLGRAKQSSVTTLRRATGVSRLAAFAVGARLPLRADTAERDRTVDDRGAWSRTVPDSRPPWQRVRRQRGEQPRVVQRRGRRAAGVGSGAIRRARQADSNFGGALRRPDMTIAPSHRTRLLVHRVSHRDPARRRRAGGVRDLDRSPRASPGQPLRWPNGGTNIPWNPDQGTLGPLSNAAAVALVGTAFDAWESPSTSGRSYLEGHAVAGRRDHRQLLPVLLPDRARWLVGNRVRRHR